ncbi:MAG: hypothetical protein ACKV2Q_18870 [Planctomycetaceae bacterium]
MGTSRWRVLTAYLPGIASVVNSFQSPEVQLSVYQALMQALDEKTEAEEAQAAARARVSSRSKQPPPRDSTITNADGELVYDIVEGESIHAMLGKN